MEWKKVLKPNKWKIINSIVLTCMWIIILQIIPPLSYCKCAAAGFENCINYYPLLILKDISCHCSCTSLVEVFIQDSIIIIISFLTIYVLYSLGEVIYAKYKK